MFIPSILFYLSFYSKSQADVPFAIEWQACQLLLSRESHIDNYGRIIEITIMPCAQQKNTYDCGIFTMANFDKIILEHASDLQMS